MNHHQTAPASSRVFPKARIYPISSSPNRHGWDHLQLVQTLLEGGAKLVQVREKTAGDLEFYKELVEIRQLCRSKGAGLIVNDRVDLALAVEADGVHLGQEDLPVAVARQLLGSDALIGISTHNWQQFEQALRLPVDYIAVGPIFESKTKPGGNPALGVDFVRRAGRCPIPVVAIGGITLEEAPSLWMAGAAAVAVISDILDASDPAEQVCAYRRAAEEVFL